MRGRTALCGMNIKTLCTVEFKEGGRKVKGVKIL